MKTALPLLTATVVLATSTQAALLYHYTFDVNSTANSGTGAAVATVQGTPTITAGGQSGSYADFDGGNVAGSDAVNVNVSGDAIVLGSFAIRLYVNDAASGGTNFDDFLAFTDSNGGAHFLERSGASGTIALFGDASISGTTNGLQDGNWHELLLTGATSGADALFTYSVDGTVQGTSTYTGAAAFTLNDIRIAGRVGADNRFIDAGIDEVQIFNTTTIPEPSSTALLGLGGLALLLRRRR
ncbi:hypothetical protein NT6N_22200 [Oceaniferula spumae]|uniref:Ice-binding protein C-terminal domain-containing protein n=1 Tax=Oceaniferula spumae TaxID=2979115 RepID=A0AAT9FMC8_9BACT